MPIDTKGLRFKRVFPKVFGTVSVNMSIVVFLPDFKKDTSLLSILLHEIIGGW